MTVLCSVLKIFFFVSRDKVFRLNLSNISFSNCEVSTVNALSAKIRCLRTCFWRCRVVSVGGGSGDPGPGEVGEKALEEVMEVPSWVTS